MINQASIEKIVESFIDKGKYIKVYYDDEVHYYLRDKIYGLELSFSENNKTHYGTLGITNIKGMTESISFRMDDYEGRTSKDELFLAFTEEGNLVLKPKVNPYNK